MRSFDRLYIGGQWVAPAGTGTYEIHSPSDGSLVGTAPEATNADVDRAVAAARQAFDDGPWPWTTGEERAQVLEKISTGLQVRMDDLAKLISAENGSPYSFSLMAQVLAASMVFDYFTGLARTYPFEEVREGMLGPAVVRKEAVGVAAAVVPWNVPLYIIAMKLGAALCAGTPMVIKPSPETPLDTLAFAEILEEAGLPEGVVSILPAGREVGEYLVTHPGVDKVTFTGSTAVGRHIASVCGAQLKRVTLELGGKSAAILCDDVDLEASIPALLPFAIMNNGQACVAQTRILAPRSRYDEVAEALAAAVGAMKVGDALDPETEVGPLVAERQRDRVEGYIGIGQDEGAKIAVGGGRPEGLDAGWFVEPTLFVGVENSMRIAQEEIFGPVLSLIAYDDDADAVRIANDSEYGLSGTVWTEDLDRGLDIARKVRTGTYSVNHFGMDFGSPFGGFKASGLGRELGPEGLSAYLEDKSISMPAGWEPKAP
jgi:betaine-aldehyde dehydrogenase